MQAGTQSGPVLAGFFCGLLFGACVLPVCGASASTYNVIYSFCAETNCTDGSNPESALVMDAAGNLYGTTEYGGKFGNGTVFELIPNARHTRWKRKAIHDFCAIDACADGENPVAALVIDKDGNLYGTTPYRGRGQDAGTVYKLSPDGDRWRFETLHSFCRKDGCPDGWAARSALTYAGETAGHPYDGTSPLYGATHLGGKFDGGAMFRLTPDETTDGWTYDVLYSFCTGSSCKSQMPLSSSAAIIGPDGALYGTDEDIDHGFDGDLYQLTAPRRGDHWKEHTLHAFCALANCADGDAPKPSSLTFADSLLYGTTEGGGAHSGGTVFSLDPATAQLTTLYSFCSLTDCADGAGLDASVLRAASGDLFGVARSGGVPLDEFRSAGTAFVLHNGAFSLLHTFCSETDCADGANPVGGLVMSPDGKLYGMANSYGPHNGGVVFAITP
jgi:uncharacterized repeat protein (TIGR03803 family)